MNRIIIIIIVMAIAGAVLFIILKNKKPAAITNPATGFFGASPETQAQRTASKRAMLASQSPPSSISGPVRK